jgi:hypothetical protein
MPAEFPLFEISNWTTWLAVVVGLTVAVIVFVMLSRYKRRILLARAANEDLPWEKLLDHLRSRGKSLVGADLNVDDAMPPEQFIALLLSLPANKLGKGAIEMAPGERRFREDGTLERRSGKRRWGNPTEVFLDSPRVSKRLRGLIVNRSAPGVAIFVNEEVEPGTTLQIRAVEAPISIPSVDVTVKYCRKTLRNFILGCHAGKDFPWNVRGWFG